ncbi:hypothetical protein GW17_00061163 [Ensete ventricosum]|nr:hypothetical protein GW17_00061163 [Ensete ventricosum]RZR96873.1 hypothetical protein BHM03_00025991 [Ensete ventricosum]
MGECHGTTKAGLPCIIGAAGELDYFSAYIRLRVPSKSEDKVDGVEAGGRKGRGSDYESGGAQLPKSKASVRKEVDSEEHHSAVEADLPITKEGMQMKATDSRAMGLVAPWYRRGGTSWSYRSLTLMEGEHWS